MIITEERRQQLIADCKRDITITEEFISECSEIGDKAGVRDGESLLERQQITLAALEGSHDAIVAAAEKLVRCKGRYHSEQNYRALAALFGVTVPDLEPLAGDGNCLAVPNGWKLVPEDADQNMIDAAYRALDAGVFPGGVYADMIATAPLPPAS